MLGRLLIVTVLLAPMSTRAATVPCLGGTPGEYAADAAAVRATLDAIDAACPCGAYGAGSAASYRGCARDVVTQQVATSALRAECARTTQRFVKFSTCGTKGLAAACIKRRSGTGAVSCTITPTARCLTSSTTLSKRACPGFTRCLDAADTNDDLVIAGPADSGECSPRCGDGTEDAGEQCDDGNTTPFDGCDPTCRLEPPCDPDGTYFFAAPLEYVCNAPGFPTVARSFDRLTFSEDGARIDLGLAGVPPAGATLSCLGSPIDRSDVELAPSLIECALVARVRGSFASVDTATGTLEVGLEGYLGGPCYSGICPAVTVGTFSAAR